MVSSVEINKGQPNESMQTLFRACYKAEKPDTATAFGKDAKAGRGEGTPCGGARNSSAHARPDICWPAEAEAGSLEARYPL